MFNSYTKCTNCDLTKHQKWYFDTKITPKEGVQESLIRKEYCEECENFTRWFMGKGVPTIGEFIFSSRQLTLKNEEKNFKLFEEEIRRIEKISNNFFNQLRNALKLNLLKKKRKSTEMKIREIKEKLDNSINNSDSIKFYNNLNPTPRCLECGHNKLYQNPKHTCGGDIVIETDDSIHFNPSWSEDFVYEYDEFGNVTKKQILSTNIILDEETKYTPPSKEILKALGSNEKEVGQDWWKRLKEQYGIEGVLVTSHSDGVTLYDGKKKQTSYLLDAIAEDRFVDLTKFKTLTLYENVFIYSMLNGMLAMPITGLIALIYWITDIEIIADIAEWVFFGGGILFLLGLLMFGINSFINNEGSWSIRDHM